MAANAGTVYLDRRLRFVGVSFLRKFNAETLRNIGETRYVIQDSDEPIAVLVGYAAFMAVQDRIDALEQQFALAEHATPKNV
jgi:hypothetical protein